MKTLHTDCFAYNESEDKNQQCCALTERICNEKKCKFYAVKEDVNNETIKLIKETKQVFKEKNEKKEKK